MLGLASLEIFGLAWLSHIVVDRAIGYGLRAPDGTIKPPFYQPKQRHR